MRVLHISHSDGLGGAAKAAYRIHNALIENGIQSFMYVSRKVTNDNSVVFNNGLYRKFLNRILPHLIQKLIRIIYKPTNPVLHSYAFIGTDIFSAIKKINPDVINLHWVNHEVISIHQIRRLNLPIVWTCHDMWPICGAEHLSYNGSWKSSYKSENWFIPGVGINMNKWVFSRKKSLIEKNIYYVTPSKWLANNVIMSELYTSERNNVTVIPNPIDKHKWKVLDKSRSKKVFNLQNDRKYLLYIVWGEFEYHKGFDLFMKVSGRLLSIRNDVDILIVGGGVGGFNKELGSRVIVYENICDDIQLNHLYNAVDVLAITSRIDNFPNTACESITSGTPVVAFDIGGLSDIINDSNGKLVKPYSIDEFVVGLNSVLSNQKFEMLDTRKNISKSLDSLSPNVVAEKYIKYYKDCIYAWQN